MPLNTYDNEMTARIVGQIATLEDSNVKSRFADTAIKVGRAAMVGAVAGSSVKNIFASKASATYDADFVASNSIPFSVNGVAITPVVYATSHAATFAALIAAIDALDGVSAVAGSGREIIVTIDDAIDNIAITNYTVTGGSSQATLALAYTSLDVFEGIAALRHGQPSTIGGSDDYAANDEVNNLTKGVIAVEVVATVAYNDSAYVYTSAANPTNQGQFTNSSSGNIAVPTGKFRSAAVGTTSVPAIALLEVNLPA